MDFKNYEKLIKCLIQSCKRRKNEKRIRSDKNFFIFSFLLLIIAIWLASALLLLDKSPPPNGHPQRIITPSPDGCNCNNLALNVWPFISDKYKRRLPSKLISKWFFVLLLLCAGDVHPNPGPGQSERIQLLIKKQLHVKLGPVFGFKEVGPVLEFGEVGPVFGFREAYLTVKKMPKVCPARRCGMQVGDIIEAGTAENLKNSHLIEDEILRKGCIGIGHMKITVLRPIPLTYEEPISAQNAIYETPVREQHQEQLTSVPPYKGKKLFQDADFPTRSIGRKRKCTNEIDTDRKSMKKVKRQIEKSTNLLSPDIICSGHSQKVVSFYFNPVDLSWQLTRAALLGLNVSSGNSMRSDSTESRMVHVNSAPIDKQEILGDGNCLYRALSFIIIGNEDSHEEIRKQVVRFMKENWKKFANMEGCDKSKFDAKMDEMAKNSTWGTWLEIFALATLMQTTIYTYIRAEGGELTWVKYAPLFQLDDLPNSDRVIMLANEACHYEPVFDVENKQDKPMETPDEKCRRLVKERKKRYCEKHKEQERARKREQSRSSYNTPEGREKKQEQSKRRSRSSYNTPEGREKKQEQNKRRSQSSYNTPEGREKKQEQSKRRSRSSYDTPEGREKKQEQSKSYYEQNKPNQRLKKIIATQRKRRLQQSALNPKVKYIQKGSNELVRRNTKTFQSTITNRFIQDIVNTGSGHQISQETKTKRKASARISARQLVFKLEPVQKRVIKKMRDKLRSVIANYYQEFETAVQLDADWEQQNIHLTNLYAGDKSQHVLTHEQKGSNIPFDAYTATGEELGVRVITIDDEDDPEPEREGTPVKGPSYVRPCDDNCVFPDNWAARLHSAIGRLDPDLRLLELKAAIMEFETCRNCDNKTGTSDRYRKCGANCKNMIKLCRSVMPHYPKMRNLIRRIYEIRECNVWLSRIDECLCNGSWVEFTRLMNFAPKKSQFQKESEECVVGRTNIVSEEEIETKYRTQIRRYEKDLHDYLAHECAINRPPVIHLYTDSFRLQQISGQPLYEKQEKDLDHLCYPEHYPNGRNGMYYPRQTRVMPAMYVKARLRHCDPRFRRDAQKLFHWTNNKDMRAVDAGIYATMNTTKVGPMNAGQLRQKLQNRDEEIEGNLTTILRQVRGTKEYWRSKTGDLNAMDEQLGPSTFFLTLSCAEYRWPELKEFLKKMNGDIPNIDSLTQSSLCASDPVTVVMHFQQRFASLMRNVIEDKNGPLGEVEHWFWRLEYQARGAPHIHMKIWVKNAPVFDKNNSAEENAKVLQFIQDHITCEIPDIEKNPRLHQLVDTFQIHSCSNSCKRPVKVKGKIFRKCRFGFPRAVVAEPSFNSLEETVRSRRHGTKVLKIYNLLRTDKEQHVNDYNPAILLLWGANIDIQYLGESSMILNRYLTSYISKSEKQATADLWESINQHKSIWSRLKSYALKSFKYREQGIYEAADKLLSHQLYGSKDTVDWCDAQMKMNRNRRLKPFKDVQTMNEESTKIYFPNMIDDYYPNRPQSDTFNNMCLYALVTNYEFKGYINTIDKTRYHKLDGINGYLYEKAKPCVVKTRKFKPSGDTKEKYFHQLLMLFKPWRNEEELLCGKSSYQEAFDSVKNDLDDVMGTFLAARKRIENAIELSHNLEQKAADDEPPEDNNEEVPEPNLAGVACDDAIGDFQKHTVNEENMQCNVNNLNSGQRRIYEKIVNHIICGQEQEAVKMFVSGVAGTGKSFLIQTICDKIRSHFGDQFGDGWVVAVLAPTGLAAFNVNGITNHRFFKLPVQHGADAGYWQLSKPILKQLREELKNLKLIIIDEISMVSNVALTQMHLRLDEIFGGIDFGQTFGNKNLLFFGDLLQLPPVNSQMCFETLQEKIRRAVFGSIPVQYDFWDDFDYDELTQNVRQAEDEKYGELLNRIRIAAPTEQDIEMLMGRLINQNLPTDNDDAWIKAAAQYFKENLTSKNALCLLPLVALVQKFNLAMLELNQITPIIIPATDSETKSRRPKQKKKKKNATDETIKNPASLTAGLERDLIIGIGARVMLRRNLDTEKGLVNGAIGTIRDVQENRYGVVCEIMVHFDGQQEVTKIEPFSAEYELGKKTNVFVTRDQFPLTLAYAVTIHKSQGLSLDAVLLDIGSDIFEAGMIYVALSRAKRLSGVHLIRFNPTKIVCTRSAVKEYNRLREKFTRLPRLPECNKLPKKYGYTTDFYYKQSAKKNVKAPLDSINPTQKVQPKPDAKKNVITSTNVMPAPIKLQNFRPQNINTCYANAVVQALLGLDGFRKSIKSVIEGNLENVTKSEADLCRAFANLITVENTGNTSAQSTFHIRELIDGPNWPKYQLDDQQDSSEFLMDLLRKMPANVKALFLLKKTSIRTCHDCGNVVDHSIQGEPEIEYITYRLPGIQKMQFAELFGTNKVDSLLPCSHCHRRTYQDLQTDLKPWDNSSRYFLLRINHWYGNLEHERLEAKTEINGFLSTGTKIFGQKFRACSAVTHNGTEREGHNCCWRKIEREWLLISDHQIMKRLNRFVGGLRSKAVAEFGYDFVYILIMERL